ncbi:hypothetical protein ACE6H2_017075 [Prunus campanulata]
MYSSRLFQMPSLCFLLYELFRFCSSDRCSILYHLSNQTQHPLNIISSLQTKPSTRTLFVLAFFVYSRPLSVFFMPFPDALLVFSLFRFRWSDRCYVLMEVAFRFAGGCFVTGDLCLLLMEEDAFELHRSVRWRRLLH